MSKQLKQIPGTTSSLRRLTTGWLPLPMVAAAGVMSLAISMVLAGCQTVSGFNTVSLVRVIDGTHGAPALNVYLGGTLFAANLGQGNFTAYGGFGASLSTAIKVTGTTTTNALATASITLVPNKSQSALITNSSAGYQISMLQDQTMPAPTGHSEFRILNQAITTGAVDVYFLADTTATGFETAKPVIADLAAGANSGYLTIPSSTLYTVIAPAGTTLTVKNTAIYISNALALSGGEVRTVLVVDPVLVTQPVQVYLGDDVH